MNMTPDEIIEVVQAHKDKKTIQWAYPYKDEWVDVEVPSWNFEKVRYRVKPAEPAKIKLCAFIHREEGGIIWRFDCVGPSSNWIRVPELDKEITLPAEV